jgi:hypothetical protein
MSEGVGQPWAAMMCYSGKPANLSGKFRDKSSPSQTSTISPWPFGLYSTLGGKSPVMISGKSLEWLDLYLSQ